MTTFASWTAAGPVISQVPDSEIAMFLSSVYTIGGMMIFPGNKIDGKITINGARGFNPKIADRFDLTLECIRRHYRKEPSPLGQVLERYGGFFALFVGRLVGKKGLRHLIDAMPAITRAHPGAFLSIVGFGPEEAACREQVARLGLQDSVKFLGGVPQSELPALYRRAAVFVAPRL